MTRFEERVERFTAIMLCVFWAVLVICLVYALIDANF